MIVIIGAGIAGLYLGYLLKSQQKDFIIIEKDKRYGGRIFVDKFDGKNVSLGAGLGRFKKDKTLYDLCKTLNVTVNNFPVKISYSFPVKTPLLTYVEEMKDIVNSKKINRSLLTFLQFLSQNYKNVDDFINICGYTDYIHADTIDTLYDYGFDDNVSGWEGFSIVWDELLDNLYNIVKSHIYLDEKVIKIDNNTINTDKRTLKADKIICSTPVNISRKIFPSIPILSEINCQSFSRIFVKITEGNDEFKKQIKNFTIIKSFLRKIIPLYPEDGIYMLGYNDNDDADLGFKYFTTLDEKKVYTIIEEEIYKTLKIKVKIELSKIAYWDYGTTYYLPLSKKYRNREEWLSYARNPEENIFFIGEGYSHNQGWVQGSLESVDSIINLI